MGPWTGTVVFLLLFSSAQKSRKKKRKREEKRRRKKKRMSELSRFSTNTQAAMGRRDDKTIMATLNKIFIVFFSGFPVFFFNI